MNTVPVAAGSGKVRAPSPELRLRVASTPLDTLGDRPSCWLVGTHGGAGATLLSHVLAPLGDAGQVIPAANDPATTVLVCANTMEGLISAHLAISQFRSDDAGGADLLGLVVVDTAPPLKDKRLRKKLADKLGVVEAAAPQTWRIPFVPEWRAMRVVDMPVWTPLDDRAVRSKKRPSPVDEVPLAIAEVGAEIHQNAVDLYRELYS